MSSVVHITIPSTVTRGSHRKGVKEINNLVPDYMAMGERGMDDMSEMEIADKLGTNALLDGQLIVEQHVQIASNLGNGE